MFRLLAKLGRWNLVRVALVYAGFAWEAFHTSTTIKEAYALEPWFMNTVTTLLGLGLPRRCLLKPVL